MSIPSARRSAEELLDQLDMSPVRTGPAIPIDVYKIAKKLGIPVFEEVLSDDQHGEVSGLLVSKSGKESIFVNKNQHSNRKRFTIAHELGHKVLKHNILDGDGVHVDAGFVINKRSLKSSTGSDYREVEANQFAAALLMPTAAIHREVGKLHSAELNDLEIEGLAEKFEVSQQAMMIRLDVLGLLA